MVGPTQLNVKLNVVQGTLQASENVTLSNGTAAAVSVNSVIVYTDYANIQLQVVCGQMPDSAEVFTEYLVLVRDRAFNNLKALLKVLKKVADFDDYQTIDWLNNAQTCPN